jgi:hypothetical protein
MNGEDKIIELTETVMDELSPSTYAKVLDRMIEKFTLTSEPGDADFQEKLTESLKAINQIGVITQLYAAKKIFRGLEED